MNLFEESAILKVLSVFLTESGSIHVNEVARNANVASGTASQACIQLEAKGILIRSKKANLIEYKLNSNNPLVRSLKVSSFLEKINNVLEKVDFSELISVAIYGSYANGSYTKKSDLDVLVISGLSKDKVYNKLKPFYEMGFEVNLTNLNVAEWNKLVKSKNPFYLEVLSKHVLISGSPLL